MTVTNKIFKVEGGCTVALGTFDGVHLGHRRVIEKAKKFGLPVVVVTTSQNPQDVLSGGISKRRIFSEDKVNAIFEGLGVEAIIKLDFNDIKSMEPVAYLDMLTEKLGAENIVFGFNFRFGRGAVGNTVTALDYAVAHGMGIHVCEPVKLMDEPISSTRIRAALEKGNMMLAAQMLGCDYTIDLPVVHGDARGRTMGYPTANQIFGEEYTLPKFGVYASRTTVDGVTYTSVTNVGIRPTFLSDVALAETYIDGFCGDLYEKHIEVALVEHLRDEVKFNSLDELKAQLTLDLERAKGIN